MKITVSEKQFSQQVVDLAKILGWKVYRCWLSIHSPAGFPDLTMVKTLSDGYTVILFVELKRDGGKLTQSQIEWLGLLRKPEGCFSFVWTPSQFDAVVEILEASDFGQIVEIFCGDITNRKEGKR